MQVLKWGLIVLTYGGVAACGDTKKETQTEKIAEKLVLPVEGKAKPRKSDGTEARPMLPVSGEWTRLYNAFSNKQSTHVETEDGFYEFYLWRYDPEDKPLEQSLRFFSFKDEKYHTLDMPIELGKLYGKGYELGVVGLSLANNTVHLHNVLVSRTGRPEDMSRHDVLLHLNGMSWQILDEPTKPPKEEESRPQAVSIPEVDPKFQKVCKENPLETDKHIFFFGCQDMLAGDSACDFYSSMYDKTEQKWYQMGKIRISCFAGHSMKWTHDALYIWGGIDCSDRLSHICYYDGVYRFHPSSSRL